MKNLKKREQRYDQKTLDNLSLPWHALLLLHTLARKHGPPSHTKVGSWIFWRATWSRLVKYLEIVFTKCDILGYLWYSNLFRQCSGDFSWLHVLLSTQGPSLPSPATSPMVHLNVLVCSCLSDIGFRVLQEMTPVLIVRSLSHGNQMLGFLRRQSLAEVRLTSTTY